MNTEIKTELIAKLKEMGGKEIPGVIEHPIIKVLIPILEKRNPDVDFRDLSTFDEKGMSRDGRPISWDNILHHSGMTRIDFYLDIEKITYIDPRTNKKETRKIPKWAQGYKHNTVGSLLSSIPRQIRTYGRIGELIEAHYVE